MAYDAACVLMCEMAAEMGAAQCMSVVHTAVILLCPQCHRVPSLPRIMATQSAGCSINKFLDVSSDLYFAA